MEENDIYCHLIFGRYKIIRKLDEGSFSKVYLGINIKNNMKVAIKLESKSNSILFLKTEAFYLLTLKGLGIPKIETFGHNEKYNILVESLLGKSLNYLFYKNNRFLCFKDVLMAGIQIIERLQFIHSKNILHRDLKPENFLIGYNDPYIIYLIDFGLAKKYRSGRTGKHIKFSIPKRYTGTARYSSVNSLRGYQVSRRDDIESVAYILIYFMKGSLPWEHIQGKTKADKYTKIFELKNFIPPENLCKDLPNEICEFLKYTKSLDFEQEPDYTYCISLFNKALKNMGYSNDLLFSWIEDKSIIKKLKEKTNRNNNDLGVGKKTDYLSLYDMSKRKSSPQTRIYHTLQNYFEKKRLNSFTNINNFSNNLTIDENTLLFSDKKYSMDLNEQKSYINRLKIENIEHCKINSLMTKITNESSSINYKNKDDNNNSKTKKEIQNSVFTILPYKILQKKNNNIKTISKNNNNIYKSYSERKHYNPKSKFIIEKINKQNIGRNFFEIKNNTNLNLKQNKIENNLNINSYALDPEIKSFETISNRVKLLNIEKNIMKNNKVENNISNTFEDNILNRKKENINEKNIIRITNIYKTKINDKKNYFNIIQNNSNNNINQSHNLFINHENKNTIKAIKNVLKVKKINKNINNKSNKKSNHTRNIHLLISNSPNNNQILFNKMKLTNSNNIINNNNLSNLDYNYENIDFKNKISKSINIEIRKNYLKQNEIKNRIKISKSCEPILSNNIIDISNEGESKINNIDNNYNKNDNKFLFNNRNTINTVNENKSKNELKKKIQPINKSNLYKKKLLNMQSNKNQIIKTNNKNIISYINYNNNLHNTKSKKEKNIHHSTINNLQKLNNSNLKNLKPNNILSINSYNVITKSNKTSYLKNNQYVSKLTNNNILNPYSSNTMHNIKSSSNIKNVIHKNNNVIFSPIIKTKMFQKNNIKKNINNLILNTVNYSRNSNILNSQKLEYYQNTFKYHGH